MGSGQYTHKGQYLCQPAIALNKSAPTLTSVPLLCKQMPHAKVVFDSTQAKLETPSSTHSIATINNNGLYEMNLKQQQTLQTIIQRSLQNNPHSYHLDGISDPETYTKTLHTIFGAVKHKKLKDITQYYGLPAPKQLECETCTRSNMRNNPHSRQPIPEQKKLSVPIGTRISMDLMVNIPISRSNHKHAIVFTETTSGYIDVELITNRDIHTINHAITMVMDRCLGHLKTAGTCRIDNELNNPKTTNLLQTYGYHAEPTAPHDSQTNAYAERSIGIIRPMSKAMISHSNLPQTFCADAIVAAANIYNYIPKRDGKCPYHLLYGHKPLHQPQYAFGTPVLAKNYYRSTKWDDNAIDAILLHPSHRHVGNTYKAYNPRNNSTFYTSTFKVKTHQVSNNNNVPIVASQPPNVAPQPPTTSKSVQISETLASTSTATSFKELSPTTSVTQVTPKLPINTRVTFPFTTNKQNPQPYPGTIIKHYKNNNYRIRFDDGQIETIRHGTKGLHTINSTPENNVNIHYQRTPNTLSKEQRHALQLECDKLNQYNTFKVHKYNPSMGKLLSSRFLFKVKEHTQTHKARYVFDGSRQVEGIHYQSTTSPVASKQAVRLLTAVAHVKNLHTGTIDFESAYLNTPLDTDKIYISIPKHCKVVNNKIEPIGPEDDINHINAINKTLCLQAIKCINGGKQCGQLWHKDLIEACKHIKFKQLNNDPCILIHTTENGTFIIITTFVDDVEYYTNNLKYTQAHLAKLPFKFRLTTNEPFVGIHKIKYKNNIYVHQIPYVNNLIAKYSLQNIKTKMSPLQVYPHESPSIKDLDTTTTPTTTLPYLQLLGELMWLSTSSRPDISFAVTTMAQYSTCYTPAHYKLLFGILKYVAATSTLCTRIQPGNMSLSMYVDASFAKESDMRSRTGFIIFINGFPISWASRKQKYVTSSSTHAEYVALSDACQELTWILETIRTLNIISLPQKIPIFVDCKPAIQTANNLAGTKKSRAIRIAEHYVKDFLSLEPACTLEYVNTSNQIADVLTKPFGPEKFTNLAQRFMYDLPLPSV